YDDDLPINEWENASCNLPELPDIVSHYHTFVDIRRGNLIYNKETNTQYVNVTGCPNETEFQYHTKKMEKNRWDTWNQEKDGLLKLEGNYIFLQCNNNSGSSVILKEIRKPDAEYDEKLKDRTPATILGDINRPSSLVDDVLLFLIDAESREKFKQEFPRLMEFFRNVEKYTNGTHKWFSMERYNTLGHNSRENKPFIYAGQSKSNLEKKKPGNWVWDTFEEQGFVTAHTDGCCGGFQNPLDWRKEEITHWYAIEKSRVGSKRIFPGNHHYPAEAICDNYKMGPILENLTSMDGSEFGSYCMGQKTVAQHSLDWVEQFIRQYPEVKRFATATFSDTHVEGHVHTALESDFLNLLEKMIIGNPMTGEKPLLSKNSVIIFVGDHGLHYGFEFTFYEGHLHHKQPVMMMLFPTHLLNSHPNFEESLKANKHRLSTHMDLHQTIMHLLYGGGAERYMPKNLKSGDYNVYNRYINSFLSDPTFRRRTNNPSARLVKTDAQIYGQSFLTPTYQYRNCESLNIPAKFCPCFDYSIYNYNDSNQRERIDKILSKAVKEINKFLNQNRLDSVCNAFKYNTKKVSKHSISFSSGFFNRKRGISHITVKVNNFDSEFTISTSLSDSPKINLNKDILLHEIIFNSEWNVCSKRIIDSLGGHNNTSIVQKIKNLGKIYLNRITAS
ncbi:19269_t:CDS:2, partial [Gigaspora margarita]